MNSLIRNALFALVVLSIPKYTFAQDVKIPSFWDKNERFSKPDLSALPRMRFLTTTDFPPFNFIDRKKRLSGFHIDLARAICDELELLSRCQIQALPWNELTDALKKGEGEAIIAGLSVTQEARRTYDFTRSYMHIPGRFIVRKDSGLKPPAYEAIFKKKTGIVANSAHEAYFSKIFETRTPVIFETREAAFKALQEKKVDAIFSDALSLSFWLASTASADCCTFLDGPFMSERYFGSGMSVALAKDQPELVQAMNYALSRINQNGKFAELYLRYFPVGLY